MTLNQLRYFCTACRTHSITKAASELYVTQPAVSLAIRELENEFNITLFYRNKTPLELTDAGSQFYRKASLFLKEGDELQLQLRKLNEIHQGLKLGIPPILSTIFFPKLWDSFHEKYPLIPLELHEYGSVRACRLVQTEQLDFALVNMEQYDIDKFESIPLMQEQLLYVIDASHKRASQNVMNMNDFKEEQLLMLNEDSVLNELLNTRFKQLQITPSVIMKSSQIYTLLQFIHRGDCGCFLYEDHLTQFPDCVGLPLNPPLYARIGIVWKKGLFIREEMKCFIDFMLNNRFCKEEFRHS